MSSAITNEAPRVLVTGASGFIGRHLVSALTGRGAHVRVLARRSSDLGPLHDVRFERCEGDLTDPRSLANAVDGVDYIYHAGGLIKAPNDETFIAVNGDGTKNLCAAAKAGAPRLKRFLYISSMAASGPGPVGKLIDEEMPVRPITPYGASKRLGEKWVQQFDFLWTIVRPPAVYGPGDRAVLQLVQVGAHHIRASLGPDGIASVVYVDNLVDGIILAAERPEGVSQTFFIADERSLSRKELTRMIQRALDTWSVPIHFPAWFVRLAAQISESIARGFGRTALFDSHKAEELLARNWACSIDKARMLLGYDPKVPTEEGMQRTARWYREAGWI